MNVVKINFLSITAKGCIVTMATTAILTGAVLGTSMEGHTEEMTPINVTKYNMG